jgi:PHD/YefM family antitoxin component YafN of YafNO toxin-antitoxin module
MNTLVNFIAESLASEVIVMAAEIQYVSDENGNPVGVIVPIELWREIESERETAYLLKSENMKRRLLEAKERQEGIPFDEAREKLGV